MVCQLERYNTCVAINERLKTGSGWEGLIIGKWREAAISPSLPGNLYEITRAIDDENNVWAIKTLRPDAILKYPSNPDLENIFEEHMREHTLFMRYLSEFIPPTCFYTDGESNPTRFVVVQPWIQFGVQYKEAIANKRHIPSEQLPPLTERIRFVKCITFLFRDPDVYPKIADMDFFIAPKNGETSIVMIDTNFLWFPKHANDGRKITNSLSNFLFTEKELNSKEIKELINDLEKSMHCNQIY